MHERRAQERRNLIYYFRVLSQDTGQLIGYAANLSTEGVMLVGKKPTIPAAGYRLEMILPEEIDGKKRVEFEATSLWCKENGDAGYFESGFELNNASSDDLVIIKRLCSARTLQGRKKLSSKRLVDFAASFLGLLVLLPIFLAIGIAIRLESPGSIFFIAKRVGKFGRPFRMYKFRTMTEPAGSNGPRITAHDDPRVTRVGRLLRKTKLNELPQLINVVKGEMSLVGPRPEYLEFVEHYSPEHREALSVKPGITSLASILYADEESMLHFANVTETYVGDILPDKLRLDLLYVRNKSLLLDMDILIQTMAVLIPRFRKAAPSVEAIGTRPYRLARQHLPWFVIDATIVFLAVTMAGLLWRSMESFNIEQGRTLIAALALTAIFSIANWLTGVQRVYWRYASPTDAINVLISASSATAVVLVANSLVPSPRFPAEMLLLSGIFAMCGFLAARYHRHLLRGLDGSLNSVLSASAAGRERALIVGAGYAGQLAVSILRKSTAGRAFHVVGFVDDDLDMVGTLVHRVPVVGVCDQIPEIVRARDIGVIVFAIHSIEQGLRDDLLSLCEETATRMIIVPDFLGSLHRDFPPQEVSRVIAEPGASESQSESTSDGESLDLNQQIHLLADKARRGEITDVAKGLDNLDRILKIDDTLKSAEPPDHWQARSKYGDQNSP